MTPRARMQADLFAPDPVLPEGFRYEAEVLPRDEHDEILARVATLPFREFEFHGFTGKRRVVSYGWRYDFNDRKIEEAADIPPFLIGLRVRAAGFARLPAEELQQVLVTEYGAGAGIGWHRDKSVFGDVVGVSLLSPCLFRLRRKRGAAWERAAITAEPRSAYLMRGPARTEREHSIPPVASLRYSVTFRNLRI